MSTPRLALLVSALVHSAVAASAGPAPATEIRYRSGTDKDHTMPWEFTVSGGRHAGERTTNPVPSNRELLGFGTYNYGQPRTSKSDEIGEGRVHVHVHMSALVPEGR